MKRALILGGGTGGTIMANKLVERLHAKGWTVTAVDRDDAHVYQPGLLFIPFGMYTDEEVVRPRKGYFDARVEVVLGEIARVDSAGREVHLRDGRTLGYDLLILATGSELRPEKTPGLTGPGWRESAFDFYTLDGAKALREKLATLRSGRVLLNVVEMPIKCPVAPLEFLFLAESFFRTRGLSEKVEIAYATPLEGAFTKPRASALLGDMLTRRGIKVIPDFSASEVDGASRILRAYDGREERYDVLVTIPLHAGSAALEGSDLVDGGGWVRTHKHTLQSVVRPEVFAIGDCTDLPSSKAGAVAHFQSDVLIDNALRFIDGRELVEGFDGHANCFIETGDDKAVLIDFNYDTEPLPGRFPLPVVGPFSLLEESVTNHLGKLAFKWVYWNLLLSGKEFPLDHRMLTAGKWA
ncbi:MAG: FAD/NAD(P)-binding oxidoreductase [Polyangiales bacterium]